MKIPLSISEAAGLRMPVRMEWEAYNVLTRSAYLMTTRDDQPMLDVLTAIRENIENTGGTVGQITVNPITILKTTLRYEINVVEAEEEMDNEVVLFVYSGGTEHI